MISFADFEYILENRVEFNLLSKFNRTKDPELKAIISLILLAESISNGAIITLKKLTFATALEGIDLWRGKVNTRSYAKIKTIGDLKEWLRGGKYYGNYRSLDKKVNTSHNLHNSIMNNVGNLSTLMNEANASYHAAALAKKYNLPREMQKAGNKSLDYSFRTYESNAANKMMTDDTVRLLGKYKNK